MFWIIFLWLILQYTLINITPSVGIQIPPSIFYIYTFLIVIPVSLLIAYFVSSRTLINQKAKFANFLFGTTTILDIIFMLTVPSIITNLPTVIKTETSRMLTDRIDPETKKEFLKEIEKISKFTVNMLYADPQLINQQQWENLSNFWDRFATTLKDGKIDKEETKDLMKIYTKLFPGEVTNGTKSGPHRNSGKRGRNMGKDRKDSRHKGDRGKDSRK